MTIESPPLYIQADTYPARLDRFPLALMFDEGVMKPTHCKVTQRGAGANFSVDIAVGTFVIQGDDQTNQGNYIGRVTATENVAITAAPGANSRYDLVTLRVNDPNAGGNAGNNVTAVVVAGTASASPTVPALPASSIPLAVIGPIATATASITNSLINDAFGSAGPTFARSCRLVAGRIAPVGTLDMFAGSASVSGWLYCDGSAVSRTTYAELFLVIGTTFGVGDGSTTFNLPDLRNRVPVAGGGSFATVGATGGEVTHTLTTAEVPASPLSLSGPTVSQANELTGAGIGGASGGSTHFDNLSTSIDTTNTGTVAGGGGAHNNMPPYQVISGYLIRT
jgi:microcystin-dependent protein